MLNSLRRGLKGAVDSLDDITGSRYRIAYYKEVHALYEQELLKKLFAKFKVDCVFDVGANIGQYATMLRRKVGYKGDIISFEPVPDCLAALRARSKADARWHIEPVALSDEAGRSTFNVMSNTQFSSLANPSEQKADPALDGNRVQSVVEVTLDLLINQFHSYRSKLNFRAPFLKMDTQGNDLRVVLGGQAVIQEFVALQSELSIVPLYSGVTTYKEAISFYEDKGFILSALVPNNPGHFPHLFEVDCIMSNARLVEEMDKPGR